MLAGDLAILGIVLEGDLGNLGIVLAGSLDLNSCLFYYWQTDQVGNNDSNLYTKAILITSFDPIFNTILSYLNSEKGGTGLTGSLPGVYFIWIKYYTA